MGNKIELNLTSVDQLFSTEEQRQDEKRENVMDIPLEELQPFQGHPFQVAENEELLELAKSIAEHGVVTPALARPGKGGGYELISGHRRKAACQLAGVKTLPVIVRDLDDDTATIIMVDSNQQRENLLPSEKAFAYKMKLDAMKRQAGRPGKKNLPQLAANYRSDDEVAKDSGVSGDTVRRYIRLTNLIPDILKMVDEKQIAFSPAVEFSYLPKKAQTDLLDIMKMQDCTPSLSQAVRMKGMQQKGELNIPEMNKIMREQKANQKDRISFRSDKFSPYFPRGYTPEQMEKSILNLLEERKRKLQKSRDDSR